MDPYSDAHERGPADFFLFALGFVGFLLGATGIVVGSVALSIFGGMVLLLAITSFQLRP